MAKMIEFDVRARDALRRGVDKLTGEEIWRGRLPAVSAAIPATYRLTPTSKQFVVLASGGNTGRQTVMAYALPSED